MKNLVLISFAGLVMASCNDSSEKTAPSTEPSASLQLADTSSNAKTLVSSNKNTVKQSTVKQKVRTKKMRTAHKATTSKKTSGSKKH